jgi:hypothetical protein
MKTDFTYLSLEISKIRVRLSLYLLLTVRFYPLSANCVVLETAPNLFRGEQIDVESSTLFAMTMIKG